VGGDVNVRGIGGPDTIVESDGPDHKVLQIKDSLSIGSSGGDCTCRMPQGAKIAFENVGGDMHVKDIYGAIQLSRLGGDFSSRRTCGMSVGSVGGCCDMRGVNGDLTLTSAGCDAVIQECSGMVRVEDIGGDCVIRDIPAGFEIGQVGGDLEISTAVQPGAQCRAHAQGDLGIELPPESSVRLIFPAGTELSLADGLAAYTEGDQMIVTLGSGEATIELSAGGDVTVRLDDGQRRGAARNFDDYMMNVSAQIDAHLRGLEDLDDLPERVRFGVERRINAAMRQVQSAQREARRAADAARKDAWGPSQWQDGESSSEAERMAILKMLEEGKITVQDAQKLLAALEGEG
jgi:SHOCT-like domain